MISSFQLGLSRFFTRVSEEEEEKRIFLPLILSYFGLIYIHINTLGGLVF